MIVVSLTTIPERLEKGLPEICVNSILTQTVYPDYIIINIPRVSKRGKLYNAEMVKKLEQTYSRITRPIIKVQFGTQDLGPITKIVPTLFFIKHELSGLNEPIYVILVDDDCIYNINMIERLTTAKKENPQEMVISTSGRLIQRNKFELVGPGASNSAKSKDDFIYVDIIETFPGSLYDYSLFKNKLDEFIEWLETLPEFVLKADDVILSFWAKKQGVKLYNLRHKVLTILKHDPQKTPELNTINDGEGNNELVYDYFINRFEKERIGKLITDSRNNSFAKFVGL